MSFRRLGAACSMVDSMLEVLLYKQSCNVQNVDSYQILEKTNQRRTPPFVNSTWMSEHSIECSVLLGPHWV